MYDEDEILKVISNVEKQIQKEDIYLKLISSPDVSGTYYLECNKSGLMALSIEFFNAALKVDKKREYVLKNDLFLENSEVTIEKIAFKNLSKLSSKRINWSVFFFSIIAILLLIIISIGIFTIAFWLIFTFN